MPDSKITALTSISTSTDPANDPLVIVDVSDTSMAATGTTKKVTLNQLLGASGTATLASATITGAATVGTTLGVTGVATFAAGTALLPALTTTGDTNTGVYYPAADTFAVTTGGSERLRIDSLGNVGIGVSPSYRLDINGTLRISNFGIIRFDTGTNTGFVDYNDTRLQLHAGPLPMYFVTGSTLKMTLDTSGNLGIGVTPSAWAAGYKGLQLKDSYAGLFANTSSGISELVSNAYNDGAWKFANAGNGAARYQMDALNRTHAWFYAATSANPITWTQAMTLDASGRLVLGTTTAYNAARLTVQSAGGAGGINTSIQNDNDSYYAINFRNSAGTSCGSISCLTSSTAFNTSSDYRLKEAVQPLIGGLARVSALKPSIYKWKADGSSGEGFLAHELAEVVPFAVTGEKDAVNEDGSIKPQGVDLSKIVPVLVAAIQELTARVQTLETR